MSATLSIPKAATGASGARSSLTRWLALGASVLAAAVAASFFGVNEYSSATSSQIDAARRNSARFEAVYSDNAETKIASLRLGVDLILANPEIVGAFIRDDRPALMRVAVGLFNDTLKPKYGTNQFNFWTPPAKLYLRASDPREFGTDGSAARRSIVTATERRAAVSGMETGLGGRLGVRAMAPILDGTRLVGIVELGDDLGALLRRARTSTGVEFAAGLDRKRSDEVERTPDKAVDSVQGTDVFFDFSSDAVGRLLRSISFNPRDPAGQLVQSDGRSVYVRPFTIANFSGAPTVVVATAFDLTQAFADARQWAVIKSIVLFLLLSIGAIVGLLQFQKLRDGFTRVVFGERKKLVDTMLALEIANAKLKDVASVKHGYFTNLVAAISEPLQAVSGQLSAVLPTIDAALQGGEPLDEPTRKELGDRFHFSLSEIDRVSRLMADYRRIELFRHDLDERPNTTTSLSTAVAVALDQELARYRRLPGFVVTASVPESLPPVRASQDLLRWLVTGLVGYAAQRGGHGLVEIVGSVDDAGWVTLSVTGSAFTNAGPPTEALLDESRQFIGRLSGRQSDPGSEGAMMAIVLARIIAEKAGGHLAAAAASESSPGFVLRLPAAV